MLKNHSFPLAFGYSVLGHTLLFAALSHHPSTEFSLPLYRDHRDIEIAYFQIREIPQLGTSPEEIAEGDSAAPQSEGGFPTQREQSVALPEGAETLERIGPSGEATVTQALSRNPAFLHYYQGIREEIRKAARRRYRGVPLFGAVPLGFTLSSNGEVKNVQVHRKAVASVSPLDDLAVQSLLDASPFSPFPRTIRQSQVSFEIVLTFGRNVDF